MYSEYDVIKLIEEVDRLQRELDKAIEYANYQIKLNNSLMNELDNAYKEIKKLNAKKV